MKTEAVAGGSAMTGANAWQFWQTSRQPRAYDNEKWSERQRESERDAEGENGASNNIVSRCVRGQGYKSEDGLVSRLGELANEVAMQLMEFSVGDFFPSLRWIDVVGGFVARL
ncbi:hypothetical protein L484_021146 [Morus notabilis]|uniref:Uncharacterized protein n=1 Tax=Morus notabilis TaxID=981085 RepID=W9QQT3_9ROSA|nr:hypothetical protein L484_021146 [Morus notabilis]